MPRLASQRLASRRPSAQSTVVGETVPLRPYDSMLGFKRDMLRRQTWFVVDLLHGGDGLTSSSPER